MRSQTTSVSRQLSFRTDPCAFWRSRGVACDFAGGDAFRGGLAQAQGVAKPGTRGGAAGGSRLLGSEAASGPARSVPPHGDPVSHRNRLSARSTSPAPTAIPPGFNVDLARLVCDEIKVTCTIQMRRFETLLDAIASNRGDAIIASLAVTPQLRARLDFTDPYYARRRGSCRGASGDP